MTAVVASPAVLCCRVVVVIEGEFGACLWWVGNDVDSVSFFQGPVGPKGDQGSTGPQGAPGLKVFAPGHLHPTEWSHSWSLILPGHQVTPALSWEGAWSLRVPSHLPFSCRGRRGSPASSSALMGPWSLPR